MFYYTVTSRQPIGKEYHGPGNADSKHGLSLYHLTNRLRAWKKAHDQGYKRMDIDIMNTKDNVPVANHSLDAMGKEGFADKVGANDVPRTTINNLIWSQVKQLRTPDGTPIQTAQLMFREAKKYNMIAAVDLKGNWNILRINKLIRIANREGTWIYIKCDPKKPHLRWALNEFRKRGCWARYNGTNTFLRPHPREEPMTYLESNPPRIRQFRRPRRAVPSGVVVVHTAESNPDEVGPDSGAESVARFIRDRTTYGSYHDLADSDGIVHLVPYDAEAYGDGTGSNPHAYHISAATQAAEWYDVSKEWRVDTVRNMAKATSIYAEWLKKTEGITIPARRISRAQSDARVPGFISHGERDPGRRSDPGKDFPWTLFLRFYDEFMTPQGKEWDEMATEKEVQEALKKVLYTTTIPVPPGSKAERRYGKGARLSIPNALYWSLVETTDDAKQSTLEEIAAIIDSENN